MVGLPWAADSCPWVGKLRTVIPSSDVIRDAPRGCQVVPLPVSIPKQPGLGFNEPCLSAFAFEFYTPSNYRINNKTQPPATWGGGRVRYTVNLYPKTHPRPLPPCIIRSGNRVCGKLSPAPGERAARAVRLHGARTPALLPRWEKKSRGSRVSGGRFE